MSEVDNELATLLFTNKSALATDIENTSQHIWKAVVLPIILQALGDECLENECTTNDIPLLDDFFNEAKLTYDARYFYLTVRLRFLIENFKYFQCMFELNMRESREKEIILHDINLVDFAHIHHHIVSNSTGFCRFCRMGDHAMVFRLIDTSIYLQSTRVYEDMVSSLLENMLPQYSLDAMVSAYKYSNEELFSYALRSSLFYAKTVFTKPCKLSHYSDSGYSALVQFYLDHPMLNKQSLDVKNLNLLKQLHFQKQLVRIHKGL